MGAALASKLDGKGAVSIAFSGDGACNQGTTFEAMNFAVVTKAPAIFVFENNHYSENTGDSYAVGTSNDIASRAESFGMKVWRADGSNFFDVFETMREVLEYVRAGNGPAAAEFDTERFYGHFEGDPQRYRGENELERIREERDPLKMFRAQVVKSKQLTGKDLDSIEADVKDIIDNAVDGARKAPRPSPTEVLDDVYATY